MSSRARSVQPGRSKDTAAARYARFADAYVRLNENGTRAAIEAGYSERSAHSQATRLLKIAAVRQLIEGKRQAMEEETGLSRDLVANSARWAIELDVTVILDENGKYLPLKQWPPEVRKCVQELELDKAGNVVKVKFTGRSTARDQAARMVGAYEKDNRQKADPLAQLLAELQGKRTGVQVVHEDGA